MSVHEKSHPTNRCFGYSCFSIFLGGKILPNLNLKNMISKNTKGMSWKK
jgi:hypothetical protein